MRYSSRIGWSIEANRVSRLIAECPPKYDLTQSNPTDAGIRYPEGAITEAFADTRALRYDPNPFGLSIAREAVSEYYSGCLDPDRLVLTASTSEAYSYVFKLLCDPGDEVLVPRPSYPLFEFLASLECVRVVQYPMHYQHGWYIDLEALRHSIKDRTRAIVFVNPNNPTGSFLKNGEFAELASYGIPLILDEVFVDYGFAPDSNRVATTAARDDALTFTLSGLSKIAGLPQMKLGWLAVSGPEDERSSALARLELIADTFLSVGSPVQYAAPGLLKMRHDVQPQIRERTRWNLDLLRDRLTGSSLRALDVEAGWYATLQVPRVRSEEEWVMSLLRDHGVLVQPGYFYDFESEAFLIISLLTEPSIFEAGIAALVEAAR